MTVQIIPATCTRCGGKGYFRCWSHIYSGLCFRCDGSGKDPIKTVTINTNTDVDASDAVDRDIANYKAQLKADEKARNEAILAELDERYNNQYCNGDHDHHYWG